MARLKRLSTAFLSALRYELDEADRELGFVLACAAGSSVRSAAYSTRVLCQIAVWRKPGFRAPFGPHFYVAYLRDPQSNKTRSFALTRVNRRATGHRRSCHRQSAVKAGQRLSPAAIRGHTLFRQPYIVRYIASLPENINWHAASWIPVPANTQPPW